MKFFQILKMSLGEIKTNKLRSFLTILGIAIGTASVILSVTVSMSSQRQIYKSFESTPLDLINANVFSDKKIDESDLEILKNNDIIKSISPKLTSSESINYNQQDIDKQIVGTDENYIKLNNLKVKSGRFIMPIDNDKTTKVVVLGSIVADELFPAGDAVGNTINIKSVPYKVIGVLDKKDPSYDTAEDDTVYMPFKTSQVVLGLNEISEINIKATSKDNVIEVMSIVENYFKGKGMSQNEYFVSSNKETIDSMKSMDTIMNLTVGAIASISLFVAGIGIMNMMLVSVTERTKEIGIRKALGSPRKYILAQFLIEALVISFIGGALGTIIGIFGSIPIFNVIGAEFYIAWNVILASVGFALVMGIVFSIVPASKAARLQPIVALRSE
ncbi:ABC transporter permease [uncultured Clostridium sp.]|uniref:ABC transporter permease n=1 Tax=uncultured Clostridium sp. TaxID=59620 RepID=UPI0025E9EA4D|nr:ABC transporter permease [uncultured Clostridium sp.]